MATLCHRGSYEILIFGGSKDDSGVVGNQTWFTFDIEKNVVTSQGMTEGHQFVDFTDNNQAKYVGDGQVMCLCYDMEEKKGRLVVSIRPKCAIVSEQVKVVNRL